MLCLKAYHIHIRSTSHNQKLAEAKKQKALAKKPSTETETGGSSLTQSSSVPEDKAQKATKPLPPDTGAKPGPSGRTGGTSAGSVRPLMDIAVNPTSSLGASTSAPKPILKSAQNQSTAGEESPVEKSARGPNYCDVCCFEFSSSEVCLLPWDYCHNDAAVSVDFCANSNPRMLAVRLLSFTTDGKGLPMVFLICFCSPHMFLLIKL